ncbi:MAG: YceI family protein, partial [Bacteroidales bacterium]
DLNEPGIYQVDVKGDLTIRGITKTIDVPAEVQVANNTINAKSEFLVAIADFNIKVPKVVEHRVAKKVTVNVNMDYTPYKK